MDRIRSALQSKVSRDKNRLVEGGYDLDFTYITERVAAMSFPATGVESTYRNRIDDVAALLEERHSNHYLVYNLSEREYDYNKFGAGRVVDIFGWPDHHSPTLVGLFRALRHMTSFLARHVDNIVIVHCLAGKGRTGTLIAALLLYTGLFERPAAAAAFFGRVRSARAWSVTSPSQLRYVGYCRAVLDGAAPAHAPALRLRRLVLSAMPRGGAAPFIRVYCFWPGRPLALVASTERVAEDGTPSPPPWLAAGARADFSLDATLRGDIVLIARSVSSLYRTETMFRLAVHTGLLERDAEGVARFGKSDLDGAVADKRYAFDFGVELHLDTVPRPPVPAAASASAPSAAGTHRARALDEGEERSNSPAVCVSPPLLSRSDASELVTSEAATSGDGGAPASDVLPRSVSAHFTSETARGAAERRAQLHASAPPMRLAEHLWAEDVNDIELLRTWLDSSEAERRELYRYTLSFADRRRLASLAPLPTHGASIEAVYGGGDDSGALVADSATSLSASMRLDKEEEQAATAAAAAAAAAASGGAAAAGAGALSHSQRTADEQSSAVARVVSSRKRSDQKADSERAPEPSASVAASGGGGAPPPAAAASTSPRRASAPTQSRAGGPTSARDKLAALAKASRKEAAGGGGGGGGGVPGLRRRLPLYDAVGDAKAEALFAYRPPAVEAGLGVALLFRPPEVAEKAEAARARVVAAGAGGSELLAERGGWLIKRGAKVKSWKRRWFVLRAPTLAYYTSPTAASPQGSVPLSDVWACRRVPTRAVAEAPTPHLLEIVTAERSFLAAAECAADADEWVDMLQAVAANDAPPRVVAARVTARVERLRVDADYFAPSTTFYAVLECNRQRSITPTATVSAWRGVAARLLLGADAVSRHDFLVLEVYEARAFAADALVGRAVVSAAALVLATRAGERVWLDLQRARGAESVVAAHLAYSCELASESDFDSGVDEHDAEGALQLLDDARQQQQQQARVQ